MYYVYILKSIKNGKIYIGSTNNLKRRLFEHNQGKNFFTKIHRPWELIYYEAFCKDKLARMREKRLKNHGRAIQELKKRIGLQNGAGFTLVELLVVIAIIGILSTIAVVNLNSARNKAKAAAALAWAKNFQAAAVLCDTSDGIISNPSLSGSYVGGGAFCSVNIDVVWPLALPEGYGGAAAVDASGGDGQWQYFVWDTNFVLPLVLCQSSGCTNP